ncbi:DUF1501 domain-containing protein [Undibacterium cyanobacteriorum]|uniref:DUF1501 domain-containing protein n=1 Tax=Undibacterium cyanobacteriorum TaxID=3073561 RepID=A0ABY9RGY2_9BURK|nr:DUF1501 domain-containing protein [Undibacterium sp. 20NA77.5]WMW79929.1 DUF1501 domain-containing protein [Undibacterium sp. 20NA77.5]
MKRRDFLKSIAIPALAGVGVNTLVSQFQNSNAAVNDYRALVCIFLAGGNDGHNTLIPTDAAYNDYATSRPILALPKDSLIALNGVSAGHSFALHPGLAPLASLYNRQRLAWVANAGPLIVPSTATQVIEHSVPIPPYLMSHSDQTAMQQGWGGDFDQSGWAGRALELLPTSLKNQLNAVTTSSDRTLVLGKASSVSFMSPNGARYWGRSDLAYPQSYWTQALNNMAKLQFTNQYEAEYARTLDLSVNESTLLTQVFLKASTPKGEFSGDELGTRLRSLASVLPAFKNMGFKRQVFLIQWGSFDTHYGQRGSEARTQDAQLAVLGKNLAAFDESLVAAGLDLDVTTFTMSDFGRTLRPASGAGSDHAWGNHWFAFGGAVAGGQVLGKFPSLVLGGSEDSDPNRGGRHVPTTSTDQFAASLMQWLGLPASQFASVFPNLSNFTQKTLPLFKT